MKNYIILLSLFLISSIFLINCKKDSQIENNTDKESYESHIKIDDLRSYLPNGLKDEKKVVFINEQGNEKILESAWIEDVREREEFSRAFTYEIYVSRLFSDSDNSFYIEIIGQGIYKQNGKIEKSISASFLPTSLESTGFVPILFENGKPQSSMINKFEEKKTILGKEFKDVFSNLDFLNASEGYSEIALNQNEGLVAFRDGQNNLWRFERFE